MDLKLPPYIDKIVYDPIKGRVVYDLLFSLSFLIALSFIFWFFNRSSTSFFLPIYYSLIFLPSNIAFGLYGRNKTAHLDKKIFIILGSNLVAYTSLALTLNNYFQLTLFLLINSVVTVLPRFFLNFNIERTTFGKVSFSPKEGPILVVGGGGYIGSVLVEQLLKKGKKVRVFDKFIYSKDVFKGIKGVKNLELFEGDISDIYSLTLAVKDSKAIIHLAGIVGDPAATIDEKLTRHVNIASTRLLKETAKAFNVKKFIFASSCSVYGASNKIQNERSKTKPISLYARTKVDSEKELLSDTTDNFNPTILRFSTVFGHSRKPRFDLAANLFVAEAYLNKEINIIGGSQWRPFIHVRDISKAIIMVLDSPIEKVSRQIFNVGDDKMNITINNLAVLVKKIIGDKEIKIILNKRIKDKRDYRVSFEKIRNELGFHATVSLEKGLIEIYKNFIRKKYRKDYNDPFYINYEITKGLKKEFKSTKYKRSHFSTIS